MAVHTVSLSQLLHFHDFVVQDLNKKLVMKKTNLKKPLNVAERF